jgi:hypothetical protein
VNRVSSFLLVAKSKHAVRISAQLPSLRYARLALAGHQLMPLGQRLTQESKNPRGWTRSIDALREPPANWSPSRPFSPQKAVSPLGTNGPGLRQLDAAQIRVLRCAKKGPRGGALFDAAAQSPPGESWGATEGPWAPSPQVYDLPIFTGLYGEEACHSRNLSERCRPTWGTPHFCGSFLSLQANQL